MQKENKELKESKHQLKEFLKKEVVNPLNELGKKAERRGSFSEPGNTEELKLVTKKDIEKVKGIKENLETELTKHKTEIQKLEEKLAKTEKYEPMEHPGALWSGEKHLTPVFGSGEFDQRGYSL